MTQGIKIADCPSWQQAKTPTTSQSSFQMNMLKKMFNSPSLTMDDIVKEMEKLQPKQ